MPRPRGMPRHGGGQGFSRTSATDRGGSMGRQMLCGAPTKEGGRCRNKAMIGYSRCQLHRGPWTPVQQRRRKKR
ncbi:hypothetical protein [Streptomyces yaizuensis]|uniref:Uncharacterized protein n=1 Tax=Streptomyces yaizuensis TaxID=2989713 RepID=A0ABQ5P612_9ACTN|nr:hypothetical protein [Streptomyces sp. YSPA8]GLF97898.1 hypothetical protein SYYSPA8_26395 [Streptomyces sp. YSPA8]